MYITDLWLACCAVSYISCSISNSVSLIPWLWTCIIFSMAHIVFQFNCIYEVCITKCFEMAHDKCRRSMIRMDYKMFGIVTKSNQMQRGYFAFQNKMFAYLLLFICLLVCLFVCESVDGVRCVCGGCVYVCGGGGWVYICGGSGWV